MLRGMGYEAVLITDPATAVERLSSANLDLLVIDIDLGAGLCGFELARQLAHSIDVPTLFLTGMSELDVPDLTGSGTLYAFLPKPVRREVLHTTVRLLEMQHDARAKVGELQMLLAESQRLARIGSFLHEDHNCRWTDVMYELHGVTRETFAPTCEAFLALLPAAERVLLQQLQTAEAGTRVCFEYCLEIDQSQRRLRGTAERLHTKIIGTVQDVTESERALEANRAKTEFLATMSHELRTPLNAVLGLSEAMREGTFGTVSPTQQTILGTVHASGRHLLELIDDVLDVSRVELGNLTITPIPVHLRTIVDDVADLLAPQLSSKSQRLLVEIDPDLTTLEVDPRRFKQVLINILGNAAKFSPPGSQITMVASLDRARDQAAISIADEGPGIAESERTRVFQPFVTLDASTTRSHGGVGLGLALAKRLVELHAGEIQIGTGPTGGAVFTITLPVSNAPVLPRAHDTRTIPVMDGMTVVLVENDEAVAFAMRSYLESLGCAVHLVRDGADALAGADRGVDAIVMDVQLPKEDGLAIVSKIRARASALPIVVVTAHALPGDEALCLKAGADVYLPKPVSLRRLAETLVALQRTP